ncbi:potassium channel family protein [Caulobacter sp. KR2-114]|uniref:potassium channel family protein n=1 Tax=Caulobacter sp. KR2-114 TaxID=3400912 RepID=UPI003BFE6790
MYRLLSSPLRNLMSIIAFVLVVVALSTAAYMGAGWSFSDAIYMVVLTVYTVGYGEVHPINTPYLHAVTMATMVLGCTGMILVTGALVQAFTLSEIRQLLGASRVKTEIEKLSGHVIICGYGRIGEMLARTLRAGGSHFVIVERDEHKLAEARDAGCLVLQGDATSEEALEAAGIERAATLATVLPNDAANVFITLSARSLNPRLQIIARGEAPSTETKLRQAGADKVVLPTHIGAERIAEMILFPETARFLRGSERMRDFEKILGDLGMELEMVTAQANTAVVGLTVAELEERGRGAFFVAQYNPKDGEVVTRPARDQRIAAGDGLVLVGRSGAAFGSLFSAPAERVRAGRTLF